MKRLLYQVITILLYSAIAAAQTTTVTGTVRDTTFTPIVSGKVNFQFMPSSDATISGSSRFSMSQTNCAINQPQIATISRASNVVTATLTSTPSQPFSIGDVVNVTGVTDVTYNATGFTLTNVTGGGLTLTWSQTAANSSSSGGFVGGVMGKNGTGVCTLATNSSLQPPGSYYVATVYSGGVKTSQFNFPTYLASQDISATVPTPATAPFQSFVDVISNQTIGGNKTFNGNVRIGGTVAFSSISGVNDLNFSRDCRADGMACDGVTNDSSALQACFNNAVANGQGVLEIPSGVCIVGTSQNFTNRPGMTFSGAGSQRCRFGGSCGANYSFLANTTIINCETGATPCFDFNGSGSDTVRNMTFNTCSGATCSAAIANASTLIMLFGRNNAGGASPNVFDFSQWDMLQNVQIQMAHSASANSNYGSIGVYDAAAEQFVFLNSSIYADTPVFLSGSNNLGLSSPYQTLAAGSMSVVSFLSTSLWYTSSTGAGLVAADGVSNVYIDAGSNIHSKLDGTVTAPAILLTGINSDTGWTIKGTHEDITSSGANGAFINTTHGFDRFDIDVLLNDLRGSGSPAGLIQWGGVTGQIISNSKIKIKYANGTGGNLYPLIQNTANTISESTIDLTSTLNPSSLSALTLDNAQIIAKGFTDANITLPAAAKGTMQTDTGYSILGEHKYKRMRAGLGTTIVPGDITLTGWGTGATVALGTGSNDSAFSMNITAGTTPSANPTASFNFKDGAWANTPVCTVARGELNAPTTAFFTADALTTTFFQTTFAGTPVNATTYIIRVICSDKG